MENTEFNPQQQAANDQPIIAQETAPQAAQPQIPTGPDAPSGLWLTQQAAKNLRSAAGWSKFLAIVGLIFISILFLVSLFMLFKSNDMYQYSYHYGQQLVIGGIIYLVISIVAFFPTLSFLKFANKAKQATRYCDNYSLTESMKKLSFTMTYNGILLIIYLALIVLGIIGFMIADLSRTY